MSWLNKEKKALFIRVLFTFFLLLILPESYGDSLYEEDKFQVLTADRKASLIGDNITIYVVESASAASSAGIQREKETNVSAELSLANRTEGGNVGMTGNIDNQGGIQRSGEIEAKVTTTIEKIDSNDRMFVSGKQDIVIDGELQSIIVKGWLRRFDVSASNVALSTRLADAEIEYVGIGEVADGKNLNFFQTILSIVGLN